MFHLRHLATSEKNSAGTKAPTLKAKAYKNDMKYSIKIK